MQRAMQRHRLPNATKAATLWSRAISRTLGFSWARYARTYHMRYLVHNMMDRMRSYAFCLFLQNHEAAGKRRVKTTKKEQRPAQAACTTTSTERRAHRTAHFCSIESSRNLYIFQRLPSDATYSQH